MKTKYIRAAALYVLVQALIINSTLVDEASAALTSHSVKSVSSSNSLDLSVSSAGPADPLGLGVMFGDMSGVSGKYWLSQKNAIDAGFSYNADYYATLHSDYLEQVRS